MIDAVMISQVEIGALHYCRFSPFPLLLFCFSFLFFLGHICLLGSTICTQARDDNIPDSSTASPRVIEHSNKALRRGFSILFFAVFSLLGFGKEFYTWHGKEIIIGAYIGAHSWLVAYNCM
jgi:hypothetical protein